MMSDKFHLYPIENNEIYELYKKQRKCFWQPEEINLQDDILQWEGLDEDTREFICKILSFFNGADGIIMKNIDLNFSNEVQLAEAHAFYAFQGGMEAIHNETYGILLETLITDSEKRKYYQNGIKTIESVKKKAEWAMKWMTKEIPFEERLVGWACVEGILFSGSFCAIYWLKDQGKMPGLGFSNELISRDEGMHTQFAITLYHALGSKVSEKKIHSIISEAVENEKEFILEAIPCRMIGMNSELMSQYIEYVGDYICGGFGVGKIYNTANPFNFMKLISLEGKTNFFEKRVGEYSVKKSEQIFGLDEDF